MIDYGYYGISVTCERPAILKIRFEDSDDSSIRKAMKLWGWNRLSDVVACMKTKWKLPDLTPEMVVKNYGILNGHRDSKAVVTLIGVSKINGLHLFSNGSAEAFKFDPQWDDYLIPAGWGSRLTGELNLEGTTVLKGRFCSCGDLEEIVVCRKDGRGCSWEARHLSPKIDEKYWGGH